MALVFLPVLLIGDQLVLVRLDLPAPRIRRRRGAPLIGMQRESRQQPLELGAAAGGARRWRILRPYQGLEVVAARAADVFVQRHRTNSIDGYRFSGSGFLFAPPPRRRGPLPLGARLAQARLRRVVYTAGLLIQSARDAADARRMKLALALSVGSQLAILGVFKYFNFFVDSAAALLAVAASIRRCGR
jgi:hypothetical protein